MSERAKTRSRTRRPKVDAVAPKRRGKLPKWSKYVGLGLLAAAAFAVAFAAVTRF